MNDKDIKLVAKFIGLSLLTKGLSVSPLKLQKITYFVQSWHMVFFGRENTIFSEAPEAWVNGPVYQTIYHEYKNKTANMCDHLQADDFCTGNPINALKEITQQLNFSDEQLELIESVIMLYGSKTQNQLIFMTHSEKPWVEKREGLAPYERSDKKLSFDTMFNYYKERHERNRSKQ
jgi:uncharacterized phage-associated protein